MRHRNGKTAAYLLAILLSLAFGTLAIRGVNFVVFWHGIIRTDYPLLVASVVALAVSVLVRAVRWQFLFLPESRPPLDAATRALVIGLLFNQILPFRAGEAARVVALNQEAGTPRSESLGTAVVERVYDILSLLILLLAASPFLPALGWIHGALIFGLVFTIGVASIVVVLVVWGDRPIILAVAPLAVLPGITRERTHAVAVGLRSGLHALHRPRLIRTAVVATFSWWLVAACSYWFVLRAFHLPLGFGAALLTLVTTNLALVIPSLPGGLGVFEAAAVLALGAYSVSESRALACAVVLHAVNFFPYIAGGLIALHRHAARQRRERGGENLTSESSGSPSA